MPKGMLVEPPRWTVPDWHPGGREGGPASRLGSRAEETKLRGASGAGPGRPTTPREWVSHVWYEALTKPFVGFGLSDFGLLPTLRDLFHTPYPFSKTSVQKGRYLLWRELNCAFGLQPRGASILLKRRLHFSLAVLPQRISSGLSLINQLSSDKFVVREPPRNGTDKKQTRRGTV